MLEKIRRKTTEIRSLAGLITAGDSRRRSVVTVLDKHVEKQPDNPLVLFEDRTITFREFAAQVNRYARLFLSLGVEKGATVALFMENRPEYLMIHAGLLKAGLVPALVNTHIAGDVLAHALNVAEPQAVILGYELAEPFEKVEKRLGTVPEDMIFVEMEDADDACPEGMRDLAAEAGAFSGRRPENCFCPSSSDILEYIYTSGTTGKPKATVVRHGRWIQLALATGGAAMKVIPGDVIYCCLPLYHNSGINIAWAISLYYGIPLALSRKFSASGFWQDIRRYNANLMIYIGELCRYLDNRPENDDDGDNPLQYILGNGMRAEYWERFRRRFGIKKIIEVYGATEGVGGMMNTGGVPGMIGRLRIKGVPIGTVVRCDAETGDIIRNEKGFAEKCLPGETGMFLPRIDKRSPFAGYKKNRRATDEKIMTDVLKRGDRYFVSGDLVMLHDKEYVSFVDRLGDTFRWKGENVSTNEVSDVISGFAGINDCNVYGVAVPHAEGRAGMASLAVSGAASLDWKAFSEFVCDSLPVYARPFFIRIQDRPEITGSFKQKKSGLQKEGFHPETVKDPLYFLNPETWRYESLTAEICEGIEKGRLRF